jgi:hypothetical protein
MANKWTSKPPLGTPIIPSWRNDPQYLKLWLPFQEGGGGKAYDLSGNRNHGTLTNMANPPTANSGWAGQGLRFDGTDDYVATGGRPILENSDMTVSAWINPSVISANDRTVIGRGVVNTGGLNYGWMVSTYSNRLYFQRNVGSATSYSLNTASGVVSNILQFITITYSYNTGITTFYINGANVYSAAMAATGTIVYSPTYDNGISIGAQDYKTGVFRYFTRLIDDIRIYNRALSADEVKELFVDRYGDFKPPHNDFRDTGTLFEATIYDTIAVTESLNKQSNIQQSDSITLAEMIRLAIDIEKQDTFEVGDSLSYFITRFQTIMDTIEITDLISRQSVELVKSDSVTMIDSLVKDMDISVNDSIDISDSLTKQVNLIISDSVSLSDGTITKQISISINDIITIIDSLSKIIDISLDDSVEIIEILTKFITYVMPITDTIEIVELISGQNITIVRSDTIEMVDNVEKSITLTLEDNISLTDIIQLLIQLNLDGDSFSITVADPAIIVATRRFRITVNIKKGQGSNILKKGQTTIEKL